MKKFNTREEEESQRSARIATEMERRKESFDAYRRIVAGKGYAGKNTGDRIRKAVREFEEKELEIMRKDIRDLKDMVNLLLDEIALRDKKDLSITAYWKPDYAEISEEEYWEEKMKKLNDN